MKPHIRTKKALWLSGFTHIAVLLCLSPLIALPSPTIPPEQIFQVTLVEIPPAPPPNIAKSGSSAIQQQNTAVLQPQKSFSASSPASTVSPTTKDSLISGTDSNEGIPAAAIAAESSAIAGGSGYGYGEKNTASYDLISADAAPIPGSLGYEDAIAMHIANPSYQYPKEQNDIKLTAYIRIKIAADSSIISCEVATGSGNADFDQAAIDAAWQSSFRPAKDIATGENVPSTLLVPFSFELLTIQKEQDSLW